MKDFTTKTFAAAALAAAAGCFTVRETEFPVTGQLPSLAGRDVKVQIAGFDATVTTYVTAHGYSTVYNAGPWYDWHGRYRCGYGISTVSTTEYIPRTLATPAYRNRATDLMERAGCIVQTPEPQYRVEVRFNGPFVTAGDGWATAGWMILSIFTANYGAQSWTAKLKIHDVKSGRLLLERDYLREYEVVVWGPVPIFSPAFSDKTYGSAMQDVCLSSLTDEAVADAVGFIANRRREQPSKEVKK
ncbi:MAG: hypothetical protein J6T01_06395 [Kiritimatiellae bacterium]|nr:hypothetical protein [Kiritimatiellia bacterium]